MVIFQEKNFLKERGRIDKRLCCHAMAKEKAAFMAAPYLSKLLSQGIL